MSEMSTVRELHRNWKPHKERLNAINGEHPTKDDLDFALLAQWIAFHALYRQGDEGERQPLPPNSCMGQRVPAIRLIALQFGDARR